MKILELLTPKRKIGNLGEAAAVKYLKRQRYKILEKNYVFGNHEIDIIARRGETVSYVEVKARTVSTHLHYEPRPAAAVTPAKQRAIISAASYYHKVSGKDYRARFDVIEVYLIDTPRGKRVKSVMHLEGAFNKDTAYAKRT